SDAEHYQADASSSQAMHARGQYSHGSLSLGSVSFHEEGTGAFTFTSGQTFAEEGSGHSDQTYTDDLGITSNLNGLTQDTARAGAGTSGHTYSFRNLDVATATVTGLTTSTTDLEGVYANDSYAYGTVVMDQTSHVDAAQAGLQVGTFADDTSNFANE